MIRSGWRKIVLYSEVSVATRHSCFSGYASVGATYMNEQAFSRRDTCLAFPDMLHSAQTYMDKQAFSRRDACLTFPDMLHSAQTFMNKQAFSRRDACLISSSGAIF